MDASTLIYGGLLGLGVVAILVNRQASTATEVVPIPVRVDERRR